MRYLILLLTIFVTLSANAAVYKDSRYCFNKADIPRDANVVILRSSSSIYAFRQVHPCPVTKQRTGACPGWAINHVIPLAVGGCDIVENMQWLPNTIKSCARPDCVDRFERIIYDPLF